MFDGFDEHTITVEDNINIFCRIAGHGPPLLLLHGHPQTSAMWHLVAPQLTGNHQVICADLRGYGRSSKPDTDADHMPYSKRAVAGDMVALMRNFGHDRFFIGSHDRGARVAHRLAIDHPDAVIALAMLDIAPTREMYSHGGSEFAQTYWHWFWLTQPAPFPETLINADPDHFFKYKCRTGLPYFSDEAFAEYLDCYRNPATVHACCEDYRAAISIDAVHDEEDGDRKLTVPLLVHWGKNGAIEKHFDCLALWRMRAQYVTGGTLPGGHYLAEELPDQVADTFREFFAKQG